jgi:hypothetical protein
MYSLLQPRTSCHIASWHVFRTVLPKNGFYSDHVMLIVILHTLRQPFPFQLLISKCWGPCDIRRKSPVTDTFFHKRHTQGSSTGLEKSTQGVRNTPPSPIFGDLIPLLMTSWEKKFLPQQQDWKYPVSLLGDLFSHLRDTTTYTGFIVSIYTLPP